MIYKKIIKFKCKHKAMKKYYLLILFLLTVISSFSQRRSNSNLLTFDENLYNSIEYRLVGPFRGGRAGTVAGVIDNRNLYYM